MRNALVLGFVCLVLAVGCTNPVEPEDLEFSRADVYVKDTSGTAVDGVQVRLERRDGSVAAPGGPTGSVGLTGYYFFLVNPGQYRVAITVPEGFALETPQSAAVDISVAKDQTVRIDYVLRRL